MHFVSRFAIASAALFLASQTAESADPKLYWNDSSTGKIERANLDGTQRELILTMERPGYSRSWEALAVDEAAGKIYFTFGRERLLRCNLDGSGIEEVAKADFANGVALDSLGNIYWTGDVPTLPSGVYRSSLDGTLLERFGPNVGNSVELVPLVNYYFQSTDNKILRCSLTTGGNCITWVNTNVPALGLEYDPTRNWLYWTTSGGQWSSWIFFASLDNAIPVALRFEDAEIHDVVLDNYSNRLLYSVRHVLADNSLDGRIRSISLPPGPATLTDVITGLSSPYGITLYSPPCVGAIDGTPCSDGTPCTENDLCVAGECVGNHTTQTLAPYLTLPLTGERKNRYVTFSPTRCSGVIQAFSIWRASPGACDGGAFDGQSCLDASTCAGAACIAVQIGWVGSPDSDSRTTVSATPVFRDWTESHVHIGDCLIQPVSTYEIRGDRNGMESLGLPVETTRKPQGKFYGDIVGSSSAGSTPNGIVNTADVLSVVKFIQGEHGAPADLTWADLAPACPNRIVNVADVQQVVFAFQGLPYPYTDPCGVCP